MVVLSYARAMSFLASISLENIREGFGLLRDVEKDADGQVRSAIIYGLAKYEVAINETEPKYLCQSLSVESFDTGNIIRYGFY